MSVGIGCEEEKEKDEETEGIVCGVGFSGLGRDQLGRGRDLGGMGIVAGRVWWKGWLGILPAPTTSKNEVLRIWIGEWWVGRK